MGTGEIKCRKHRRDYTLARVHTFTLLTSLIILSILCGVGGCNLALGREWKVLPLSQQCNSQELLIYLLKTSKRASSVRFELIRALSLLLSLIIPTFSLQAVTQHRLLCAHLRSLF